VELLPVGSFNGEYNWGYDGVCWYAPHEAYGGPDGMKRPRRRLPPARPRRGARRGLQPLRAVRGRTRRCSGRTCPSGSNDWGTSINLDGQDSDEVRRYIVDNALMWLRDYHVDGLRLDAVHALVDHRATHLLEELASRSRRCRRTSAGR
jgi:maltooligosyltrehalose trehalohydrolase